MGICSADIGGEEDCVRQVEVWESAGGTLPSCWQFAMVERIEGMCAWEQEVRNAEVGTSQVKTFIEGFDVGQQHDEKGRIREKVLLHAETICSLS